MAKVIPLAGAQLLLAVLVLGGVWLLLPARWAWVDVPATILGTACLIAAFAWLFKAPWARSFMRYVAWAELVVGTSAVTLLAVSAAQLAGSYGPVGAGGALLLLTVAALVLPYLVVLPILQLRWLKRSAVAQEA